MKTGVGIEGKRTTDDAMEWAKLFIADDCHVLDDWDAQEARIFVALLLAATQKFSEEYGPYHEERHI